MTTGDETWVEVGRLRCDLANRVESLKPDQWDAASWCGAWRVRDVLAHLVHLAEATQRTMIWDIMREGGRSDRALDRIARRLGDRPIPELVARLREHSEGRFRVVGFPPTVALGDVVVHSADVLRPLGLDVDVRAAHVVPIISLYRRIGPMAFHANPAKGRHLVATDTDGSWGKGPEVRGRAVDLLMLLAHRRQVLPALEGPGLAGL